MEERTAKTYLVKVLDIKYQSEFKHLAFNYIYYKVGAQHEEQAIQKARGLYMKGEKGQAMEELPFLLKIFSAQMI